jgi:hypothetical protein
MPLSATGCQRDELYGLKFALFLVFLWVAPFYLSGCATTKTMDTAITVPVDIPLLDKWSGEYPVAELGRLPAGQQDSAAGYIGDTATFINVWQAFMPEENPPAVDFSKNIVVFSRNVEFYNRTAIFKVELKSATAEILAMETMSALPIEEKVAMAMAVIPREGVRFIRSGTENIKVMDFK